MKGSAPVKVEMKNSRYPDRELKEHLSELILYSKYAGIDLGNFHQVISDAQVQSMQEGPEMRYGGRIVLQTNYKTASLVNQLVQMYPVFSTWDIKVMEIKGVPVKKDKQKEKVMAAAKKSAAKKPAKKAAAKKPAAKKVAKKAAKKK
ncbi:MAG: hypothetical protein HY751_10235 [Nitrospinae bacterium]|nr:hypothetical protein [Nitrospinota bacterium]